MRIVEMDPPTSNLRECTTGSALQGDRHRAVRRNLRHYCTEHEWWVSAGFAGRRPLLNAGAPR